MELKHAAEIEVRDNKILQQRNEIEELESQLKISNSEKKELFEELVHVKEQLLTLEKNIEINENESREREEQLKRECDRLTRKTNDYEQKETRFISEKKSLESTIRQLKEDIQEKNKENESVYQQLERKNIDIEEAIKEVRIIKI